MRTPRTLLVTLLALVSLGAQGSGEHAALQTARRFGEALAARSAADLRSLLPRQARVRVELHRLGDHVGLFSSAQVEALFRDVLREHTFRRFSVIRFELPAERHARVRALCTVAPREGSPAHVHLELGLVNENGHWAVREIRETSP